MKKAKTEKVKSALLKKNKNTLCVQIDAEKTSETSQAAPPVLPEYVSYANI